VSPRDDEALCSNDDHLRRCLQADRNAGRSQVTWAVPVPRRLLPSPRRSRAMKARMTAVTRFASLYTGSRMGALRVRALGITGLLYDSDNSIQECI
jgi:hypothetical protein